MNGAPGEFGNSNALNVLGSSRYHRPSVEER